MKVIFIKAQPGGGKLGEVKEVSEGFANNFLIPKGFAKIATPEIQAKLAKEGKEAEVKKLKEIGKLDSLKAELEKRTFTVKVKMGAKGQIFGGVHEKEVAIAINTKMNAAIEKAQVEIASPIKTIGEHSVKVKLGNGISASVKINVEAM